MPAVPYQWSDPAVAALIVAAAGALTIIGALFFQYGLGLPPCPLCLQQRWPYYIAMPLAVMVTAAAWREAPQPLLRAGLAILALIMLGGAVLGAYHAGVEWKWWAGPQDCAAAGGSTGGSAGTLLQRMQTARVVRCDEAPWRDPVLGLSLAGWNVLISLGLAAVAGIAALSPRSREHHHADVPAETR